MSAVALLFFEDQTLNYHTSFNPQVTDEMIIRYFVEGISMNNRVVKPNLVVIQRDAKVTTTWQQAVAFEIPKNCYISPTDINDIRVGDTVIFDGEMRTVGPDNLKHDSFMGVTLFGDSYQLGLQSVSKVIFKGDD